MDATGLATLSVELERLLRLRAIPFGMKLFESVAEMQEIPKIRRPQSVHTLDQVVAQAARLGWTVGATAADMEGFESVYSPEVIGCESCHLGNSFTSNKDFAHKGMIVIPGNLFDAEKTCGAVGCHPGIPQRINNSLMNTMSGVISVDRFAFDQLDKPEGLFREKELTQSNADDHLRNLCASCHLGNEKTELGPITELSRGGGCNACHLNYNNEAIEQLSKYQNSTEKNENLPKVHPQLNLKISNDHCLLSRTFRKNFYK